MTREYETSTIDRLFLELSQFSKARTRLELELEEENRDLKKTLSGFTGVPPAFLDVAAERVRQLRHGGFSFEHDDQYSGHELVKAAICYGQFAAMSPADRDKEIERGLKPVLWPWHLDWWKPKDRRRDLVRAAALIIAEIERMDRATEKGGAE